MNESNSKSAGPFNGADGVLISDDGVITYLEGEADYTVRPIPPERMAQAMAQRDLIQKYLAEQNAKRESAGQ